LEAGVYSLDRDQTFSYSSSGNSTVCRSGGEKKAAVA